MANCPYMNREGYDRYYCMKMKSYVKYEYWDKVCSEYAYLDCPKYKGCFVATTVCNELGTQESRVTLDTLYCLRHEIMEQDTQYQETLKTYDVVGPAIIEEMAEPYMMFDGEDVVDTRPQIFRNLYNMCMVPVSKLVEQNRIEEAVSLYKDTMNLLVQGYGITNQYVESNDEEQKGHGQLLFIK